VLDRELDLCPDLVLKVGFGAQCAYLLSYVNLDSLAQCTRVNECKIQKHNKEGEAVVGRRPALG
jgi:hypothetical protein